MRVLVIGGTRFLGYQTVWRLLARGEKVTLLTRGHTPDPFGPRLERLRADRATPAFAAALAGRAFDAVIDFVAYTADDVRGALAALDGRFGHYVFISTGQVYLVRESCPRPSSEDDYDGPLMPRPTAAADLAEWQYGMDKRAAEAVLEAAYQERELPVTTLRLPMVIGERDHHQRIQGYLARLLDGHPVLVPDGGAFNVRHLYADDVAHAIVDLLGRADTSGMAFNLAQEETPTLLTLIAYLRGLCGSRSPLVPVSTEALRAAHVPPAEISPFSNPWMSFLDASLARAVLGFRPTPLPEALGRIVAAYLAHPPAEPPESYKHRAAETKLASNYY